MLSRLVTQGFNTNSDSNRSSVSDNSIQNMLRPRISVSSPLLIELLHIVYHSAERCAVGAIQALHDIIHRAKYESYAGNTVIHLFIIEAGLDFGHEPYIVGSQSLR